MPHLAAYSQTQSDAAPQTSPAAIEKMSTAELQAQISQLSSRIGELAAKRGQLNRTGTLDAPALAQLDASNAELSALREQLTLVSQQYAMRMVEQGRTRVVSIPAPGWHGLGGLLGGAGGFGGAGGSGAPGGPRPPAPHADPDFLAGMTFALLFFITFPIAIAYARRIWRRVPAVPAASAVDAPSPRLDRLEQAMDAIALEIERIGEGQRFVTRLLTEQSVGPGIPGAGRIDLQKASDPPRSPVDPGDPARMGLRPAITPH